MAKKPIEIVKKSDFLWEIPQSNDINMRVPALVFSSDNLIHDMMKDRALHQLINVASLPGIQKAAMVMPDAHEGYGFPIGGVAATSYPDGVISPGGIGYDINCGVRLLVTDLEYKDIRSRADFLTKELYEQVPSGMGKGGYLKLSMTQLEKVLLQGAEWAVEEGYAENDSLKYMESYGRLPKADPEKVSKHARQRGQNQLGTLGSGNHFVEVDRVDKLFDEQAAIAYGLRKNQIVILIHTGSRGLGHQVATDYVKVMMSAIKKYRIELPDRELACAPFNSQEGQNYYAAMSAAANFAWANRTMISWQIKTAWKRVFGKESAENIKLLYDVAHNIAKVEEHLVNDEKMKLIVHRKGATRAFGPDFEELPQEFIGIGQPVLIPGSMGTHSFVLAGSSGSMESSFGSSCHGAGRQLSRTAARKRVDPNELIKELKERGISIKAGSNRGISEEAPEAYKNVSSVVDTVQKAGIARKVAKLKPVVVIKG